MSSPTRNMLEHLKARLSDLLCDLPIYYNLFHQLQSIIVDVVCEVSNTHHINEFLCTSMNVLNWLPNLPTWLPSPTARRISEKISPGPFHNLSSLSCTRRLWIQAALTPNLCWIQVLISDIQLPGLDLFLSKTVPMLHSGIDVRKHKPLDINWQLVSQRSQTWIVMFVTGFITLQLYARESGSGGPYGCSLHGQRLPVEECERSYRANIILENLDVS